ncbi:MULTISPECIES: amidohydrolase family protein [unclassified Nostoc]|uniref:amidohydrolase family protein n=1 Tax=unclassified Nostoc TaxID=2593658 RepID=UPI002AD52911|nr:amidohydrolase family protein [Nostoc sp. DedQUE03]MDZ7976058.1 amidohydrolase family protein [Nostoc sp. DedQUE03]MDZ8044888.1 amidohydrolase family protein [Nostoc sp. DedQUE02]
MSSPKSLLIRRARIILPNGELMIGDVLTRDRQIVEVAPEISKTSLATEIDAEGLTLLPGVIDPQVHFREPGLEHKEDLFTASCACAKGGVTSFLEMPNTRPLTTTQQALDDKLERASHKSLVNYGFFIGATAENLPDLLLAKPTPGIKIFMGSMHGQLLVDGETALEAIFTKGDRLIEVTSQHLLLNTSAYETIGTLAQMNPPLRSPHDNEVLWQALRDGVIDFIATDHAPHTLEEKAQEYPNTPSGMPGVETSLALMLTAAMQGKCTVAQVVNWMSKAVAVAYGIPNKGAIAPGYDADLVLVDLNTYRPVRREELLTKCHWSPFEGWNLTDWATTTIVGGEIVYDKGQVNTQVRGQALTFL